MVRDKESDLSAMEMKRKFIIIPLISLLCGCSQNPKVSRVDISNWQFDYSGVEYTATVPGFVHTDLMANGIIGDPYIGTNEDSVQ